MWDSMYDSLQTFEQQEEPFTASEGHIDNAKIETEQAENRLVGNHVSKQRCGECLCFDSCSVEPDCTLRKSDSKIVMIHKFNRLSGIELVMRLAKDWI